MGNKLEQFNFNDCVKLVVLICRLKLEQSCCNIKACTAIATTAASAKPISIK